MNPFLILLLAAAALAALYFIFIIAPALVASRVIFARREGTPFEKAVETDPLFIPYADAMRAGRDRLLALPWTEIELTAADGTRLCGRFTDRGRSAAVILLHGYRADPLLNFALQGPAFDDMGCDLLIPFQRAHDGSGGDITSLGLCEADDLCRWVDWLQRKTAVKRVVIYGVSMGASTVAYAADKLDPAFVGGLVIDCGFSSPYDQIGWDCRKRRLPRPLMMPVIRRAARRRWGFDIARPVTESLARTEIPALFLHGTDDRTVPLSQGQRNAAACASPHEMIAVEGAAHTLAFAAAGHGIRRRVLTFVQNALSFDRAAQ